MPSNAHPCRFVRRRDRLLPGSGRLQDLVLVLGKGGADQRGHQTGEGLPVVPSGERLGVARQAEPPRLAERVLVRERVQLLPDDLHLAEEDVDADVAEALELPQQGALPGRVAAGFLPELAQVAAAAFQQQLAGLTEHGGGALVVARVAVAAEHAYSLLPRAVGHLSRGRPALLEEALAALAPCRAPIRALNRIDATSSLNSSDGVSLARLIRSSSA